MTTYLFANNASSTLSGAITNTATTLNLAAGGGALFPNPGGSQQFTITIIDAATGLLREILWCTGRSTDTLTVVRGQEGTTALNWNAGDLVQQLITAGQMAQLLQQGQVPSSTIYYGASDTGTVNNIATIVTPTLSSYADGQIFEIQPAFSNTSPTVNINVSMLGNVSGFRSDGSALQPNDYLVGSRTLWAYKSSGPAMYLLNPATWQSQPAPIPSGRLTLVSATPVLSGATIAATSVFYTPYLGNSIPIWNGSLFVPAVFSELSQALSDTTHSPAAAVANSFYDYFVWFNSNVATLSRGPAWTNSTTRSLSLTRVNGILVNASSITNGPASGYGVYVGSVMTDSSGATVTFNANPAAASSGPTGGAWIGIWNNYNRISFSASAQDSKSSWGYGTATWHPTDNSTNNRITFMSGQAEDSITVSSNVLAENTLGSYSGIGVNSTTVPVVVGANASANSSIFVSIPAVAIVAPAVGQTYVQALEISFAATVTTYSGVIGSNQLQNITAQGRY